ncbi:MAG: LLM class flavin-dependent oxidoreductase [Myxococcales bacterium]|nr:LLM class flavin-dependent oxidoreductase [Myxococcales bacterium]HIK83925.1 LLM class flavin-dependent oxidoreductase [Myxococcales bacterium]
MQSIPPEGGITKISSIVRAMTPNRNLRLSVVEQSPLRKGGSGQDALQETIELARVADVLGYERFWVAEHHNIQSIASTSPEIMIGQIGAATTRIRIGSGGVMLPHYSAFKVAENFRMLETLFPGRIDLGLGRAPGGDQRTAAALAYPSAPIDVRAYPEQVDDLIGFLGDRLPDDHPFKDLRAGAPTVGIPEVWLLGSGIDSARLAAHRGLPFSFAHFFGQASQGPAIVAHYREEFRPSRECGEPKVHIAVQVMCSDTQEEAEWHASSLRLGRIQMARNEKREGIVSPEEASEHVFTPEELRFLESSGMRGTTGDLAHVVAELDDLSQQYAADHFGIVTICYDFKARLHSYELLAEAYLSGESETAEAIASQSLPPSAEPSKSE